MPKKRRWKRSVGAIVAAGVLIMLLLPTALATTQSNNPRQKFRSGNTVTVPAGETVPHDLYVSGSTVRVNGRIEGDLFVAGGTVDVSGPVTGDLFAAGGTVSISSPVDQHLRVAGGNVTVDGSVRQDLLAAAGTLTVGSAARIGGDLIFTAGSAALDGMVAGSVLGSAGTYTKGGSVTGSEEVTVREGQLEEPREPSAADRVLRELRRYLSIVLIGALLIWLAPRLIRPAAALVRERPLPSLGVGVLTFIGFFLLILGLIIAMVLVTIPLGVLGFGRLVLTTVFGVLLGTGLLAYLFTLILLFLAAAVVGLAVGRLVLGPAGGRWAEQPYAALLIGVLIVVILTALPLVGGVLNVLVVLVGLGALALVLWSRRPGVAARAPQPGLGGAA